MLLWNLQHLPEQVEQIERQLSRDRVPEDKWPAWLRDKPELDIGLSLFYDAFVDLHTCRSLGMGEGPIPYSMILDYCRTHGFDESQTESALSLVRGMDSKYLEFRESQMEKARKK